MGKLIAFSGVSFMEKKTVQGAVNRDYKTMVS